MKIKYILIVLVLAFLFLILCIKMDILNDLDNTIGKELYHLHDTPVSTIISGVGMIGSTVGIISTLFLFMIILAWLERSFVSSAVLFFTALLGNIGNKLLKAIIARERPAFPEHVEEGYSFPSGHVMIGGVLLGMITYNLVKRTSQKNIKQAIISITTFLILIISVSRLLEGEHFVTDVIGGILAGSIMLIVMIKLDRYVHQLVKNRKIKKEIAM
ncbi:phosphatase PAP2 family protein [Metabacillus schmidteae]|uniref:phosphatase PAP2 family protein n=1 Tax=Metabacillus schmidteae TaxID=2730405 RepID=UPI00158ADB46|nr:phosphatase PAP2 family protein [Metabacillus schmidteae]